jgi:hypothetical protein
MKLADQILEYAKAQPTGAPIIATALPHLGAPGAVDQALSRLARCGRLFEIECGIYVAPVVSRFGSAPPNVFTVIEQLAEATGEVVGSDCASAANLLGITTQIPIRTSFITSGTTREWQLGSRKVLLRHGPRWQWALGNSQPGQATRGAPHDAGVDRSNNQ